jgi:hypothetical protein
MTYFGVSIGLEFAVIDDELLLDFLEFSFSIK